MKYDRNMTAEQLTEGIELILDSGATTSITKQELIFLLEWQKEDFEAESVIIMHLLEICDYFIKEFVPFADKDPNAIAFREIERILRE